MRPGLGAHEFALQVYELKTKMTLLHDDRLELFVQRRLRQLYPHATDITCFDKRGGDQLGAIAVVTLDTGEKLKFFAKTHSGGRQRIASSGAVEIDPKELMAYELLKALGLGCEATYCARNLQDVYVLTLDAAAGGKFHTFDEFTSHADTLGPSLWGDLATYIRGVPEHRDHQCIERLLTTDADARIFATHLSALDILMRALRLHDLFSNGTNFGFVRSSPSQGAPWQLRILDFRLADETDLRFSGEQFGGFLVGNGFFHYETAHPMLAHFLHDRRPLERARTALATLQDGPLATLDAAIDRAYAETERYIREERAFYGDQKARLIAKLDRYRTILHENCAYFKERLTRYIREMADSQGAASPTDDA